MLRTPLYAPNLSVEPRTAKTILICEDDENLRQLLRVVIGTGYHILESGDGDEALELASQHHPDLVILDLMLPRLSGLDVLRLLKRGASADGTHILVMSAWPDADGAALAAGADAFLQKPFEPDELTAIVREVLGEPEA
jgi:DNA-binding response OmpR family regulator